MELLDHRGEYSWPKTAITDIQVISQKSEYSLDEPVALSLGFRVVGGLRESFTPDVWTTAWEENDKLLRLTMEASVVEAGMGFGRELASSGREVRKGKLYWSRNPDLPYRIWAAVVSEDGSAPIIPESVDDAKAKMFDVVKHYVVPARSMGRGSHHVFGKVRVSWGRRGFIEKGRTVGRSKEVQVTVE